jgi:hypothetical protein
MGYRGGMRLDLKRRQGFAPNPTRRLCPLDPHQGQWPLEPIILAVEWERADRDVSRSV